MLEERTAYRALAAYVSQAIVGILVMNRSINVTTL